MQQLNLYLRISFLYISWCFSHLCLTEETKFNCKQPIEIWAMTCSKIMKPTKVKYRTTKQYRFNQDILQRETVIPRVITTQQFKCTETNTYICLHTHTYSATLWNDIPEALGGESNQKRLCIITDPRTWLAIVFIQSWSFINF